MKIVQSWQWPRHLLLLTAAQLCGTTAVGQVAVSQVAVDATDPQDDAEDWGATLLEFPTGCLPVFSFL